MGDRPLNAVTAAPPDEATEAPICCRNLRKHFGLRQVLRGVNLSIPRGAVLGLVGRSGAGKSTLIRMLVGLLLPDYGTASVLGESALHLSDAVKARLGYVPQRPQALDWMTVESMLDFIGGFYPHWDREYMWNSLMRWNISPSHRLAKLSPGERQRVALIRALAPRPEVLILDEPASALDPVARRDLLREIALRAGEAGTTVLFSTHIVSDLERVASHVCFLHDGRLLLEAVMDDLKETHAHLSLSPEAAATVGKPLAGELARRRRPDGGVSIVVTRAPGAAWSREVMAAGALDAMSLEDLFIEMTDGPGAVWFPE
jgi:ABC-2 type transport system ATP-binding protein